MNNERMEEIMTIKDLKPANDSKTPDSREAAADSQEALSLEELASRQQAAMANLKETTSAFDKLLKETISAVDECITQSKKINDEVKNQASEKAAAMLTEVQAEAETIISAADREGKTQAQAAMRKVGGLIEAARSSAGRVARPERGQLPLLTGEIWAALEASIEQSLLTVLNDLENLEQLETRLLEQETKLSAGQEGSQLKSNEADQDSARSGHSDNSTESRHSNGLKAEMDDSTSSSESGPAETKPGVDDTQEDGDKEPSSQENGRDAFGRSLPPWDVGPVTLTPELFTGNVTLVILLKKPSDQSTNHRTPEQISSQINNTPGGSVVGSGMQGKEYFITAHFENPVSLHEVLDGVASWEDFEHKSDKVKEYQKRYGPHILPRLLKESKDAKRILVTL